MLPIVKRWKKGNHHGYMVIRKPTEKEKHEDKLVFKGVVIGAVVASIVWWLATK